MSMLAERKRKQKWTLNPRGKDWSEDSNKFGQKMLEKMGWKPGKGLGAKLDGMTEHVKVSYKNDSQGIGFKESDNQWTEHDVNFQSLLENLNSNAPAIEVPEAGKKSLEEKSLKSRARVHYHKFTRGKDLTRYSEKDLANIFGKKSLDVKKPKVEKEQVKEEEDDDNKDSESKNYGIQTVKGGSMADYFKKKMPSFGMFNNGLVVGSNGVLKKAEINDGNESEEERPAFGFGFQSNGFSFDYKTGQSSFVNGTENGTEEVNNVDNNTEEDTSSKKKNKKKRKLQESTEEEVVEVKKKKQKITENVEEDVKENKVEVEPANNKYEVKRKDKKKKNKQAKQVDSEAISTTPEETLEHVNPIFNEECEDKEDSQSQAVAEENKYEVKRKTKKKKRKDLNADLEVDNPNFAMDDSQDVSQTEDAPCENMYEVKRKDKKSKKKKKQAEDCETTENGIEGNVLKSVRLEENNLPLTPILKGTVKPNTPLSFINTPQSKSKRKSVRFSEVNQERLIPPNGFEEVMSLEDIRNRNELFEINTVVIQKSLEEQETENVEFNSGFVNNAFDIKSIDQMSFYLRSFEKELSDKKKNKQMKLVEDPTARKNLTACFTNDAFDPQSVDKKSFYEKDFENVPPKKKKKKKDKKNKGLDNGVYDQQENELEENVVSIAKEIENYQAEVENDINEKKYSKN